MTDQLRHELADLFRTRADEVAPTRAPVDDLVRAGQRAMVRHRRTRAVRAAVAAAAVVAVVVPLGLRATDGDSAPAPAESPRVANDDGERPATVDELPEGAPPAVPYIVAGELHVDGRVAELPEAAPGASVLLSAGDTVLYLRAGSPEPSVRGAKASMVAIDVLEGDSLVPFFAGDVAGNVRLSPDGTLVAVPIRARGERVSVEVTHLGDGAKRSWSLADGRRFELLGVDSAGRVLWNSGGRTYLWTAGREPVVVNLPGGSVAASVAGRTVTTDTGAFGTVAPTGEFERAGSLPPQDGAVRFGIWSPGGDVFAFFTRAVEGESVAGAAFDAATGAETPLLVPSDVPWTTSLTFETDDIVLLTAPAPEGVDAAAVHLRCSVSSGACDRILSDLPAGVTVQLPSG